MTKIKILHVIDKLSVDGSKIHGPARQISYRVPYYDANRFEVLICNLKNEDACSEYLRKKGLEVLCLNRSKFNPLIIHDLYRLIMQRKFSLIHVHGYASWNFGRIVARLTRVPIILQEHFVDEKMPFYQKFADYCLKGLNGRGLAVSDSVKDFMVNDRSMRGSDIQIIWNGIPVDEFNSKKSEDVRALKAKIGILQNTKVVGIVGRLAEMKGHEYFLRAAKQISQNIEKVVFIIVGEGPLRNYLENLAENLGIEDKAFFVGYQEDVLTYLSLFDVNVIASVFGEGFCSVGIESFAAGTPVVITDLACFKGIYVDQNNVLMVPSKNVDALAKATLDILNNPEISIKLARNAKQALSAFNITDIASKYEKFYEETLIL
jgi:glycosyltransferase involved in cell wall biosynthesis